MDKTQQFLKAVAQGKHRKNSGSRLRKLVAEQELAQQGRISCWCCGQPVTANTSTLEHIVPQSLGGKTVMSNLALSHAACNVARASTARPRCELLALS